MERDKKSERPSENEAVFTTIVGGRPPGSGTRVGDIPRGIEVLVKKASVDRAFRELLLQKRAEAAREIDLELTEAERGMLATIPAEQLNKIIDNTVVKPEHRAAFLGSIGRIMLATVIAGGAIMLLTPTLGHTLLPEQRERFLRERMARLSDSNDANEPNKPDAVSQQGEGESASQSNTNEH